MSNSRQPFSNLNFYNSIDATTEVLQEVNYYPFLSAVALAEEDGLAHSHAAVDF